MGINISSGQSFKRAQPQPLKCLLVHTKHITHIQSKHIIPMNIHDHAIFLWPFVRKTFWNVECKPLLLYWYCCFCYYGYVAGGAVVVVVASAVVYSKNVSNDFFLSSILLLCSLFVGYFTRSYIARCKVSQCIHYISEISSQCDINARVQQ